MNKRYSPGPTTRECQRRPQSNLRSVYSYRDGMAEAKSELQFTALTRTAEMWKSVSSAIMTIVDEAHFEANKDGLQFRSMDPSHIALIDITCPAVAFEKYECPSPVRFGFRVDDFAKVIKRAGSNDSGELGIR